MKREFDDDKNSGPGFRRQNRNRQSDYAGDGGRNYDEYGGKEGYEGGYGAYDSYDSYGDDAYGGSYWEQSGNERPRVYRRPPNEQRENARLRGMEERASRRLNMAKSQGGQNTSSVRPQPAGAGGGYSKNTGKSANAGNAGNMGNGKTAGDNERRMRRTGQDSGLRVGDYGDRISGSGGRRGQEPPGRPPSGRSAAQASRRKKLRRIAVMAALEVVFLVCIGFYGYALRLNSMVKRPTFDKSQVENKQLSDVQAEHMRGYWTIAIFGVDSRDGNVHKGTNTDVIMLLNINRDTGEIKLASVFRDAYLNTNEKGTYNKINSAYANGGAEQALAALNRNLDLNIVDYVTFNWKSVADGINMLGGVDGVDISKAEFRYINSFITETVNKTGVGSVQLKKPGVQHLDGIQAVAYGRLRLMDTDFARTERQRLIIQKTFEKAKKADLGLLNRILLMETEQIETSLTFSDFTNLILDMGKYHIGETTGFPFDLTDLRMGKKGDCVIAKTLESNVTKLHKFLYNKDDYVPTDLVKKISGKITADYNSYKSGNGDAEKGKLSKETEETRKTEKENGYKENGPASEGTQAEATDEYGNPVKPALPGETLPDGSRPTKPGETVPGGINPAKPGETLPNGVNPTKPGETVPNGSVRPGETAPDSTAPTRPGDLNPNNPNPTSPVYPGSGQTKPGAPGSSGQSVPSDANTGPGVKPSSAPSEPAPPPVSPQNTPGGQTGGGGGVNPGSVGSHSGGQAQPGSSGTDVVMVPPPAA